MSETDSHVSNSFQTPNLFIDRLMPLLEDTELRCLMFAVRHIFGWKDTVAVRQEHLSLSAFEKGRRGSAGVGAGRAAIVHALDYLAQAGVMRRIGEPGPKGQMWGLAESDQAIDWAALDQRAREKKSRAHRQTAPAAHASRKSKSGTSNEPMVRSTNQAAGTSNEPPASTFNEPGSGTFNEPLPGTSNEPIETHRETQSSKPTLETQSSTTTGSVDSAREVIPLSAVVDDADLTLILPKIRKLHLPPNVQADLLSRGAAYALAVTLAATARGVRNPSGLARHLMGNGGPPDADLERARVALELGTLDSEPIDRAINQRQLAGLNEQARTIVAAQESEEGPEPVAPLEAEEKPLPAGEEMDNGLNDKPPGCNLNWREIWWGVQSGLSAQLHRLSYENYIQHLKLVSCHDGVLTLNAPSMMARDTVHRYWRDSIEQQINRWSTGTLVTVRVVTDQVLLREVDYVTGV